jgi:F0F1-type ATP synthase gamma subunit
MNLNERVDRLEKIIRARKTISTAALSNAQTTLAAAEVVCNRLRELIETLEAKLREEKENARLYNEA